MRVHEKNRLHAVVVCKRAAAGCSGLPQDFRRTEAGRGFHQASRRQWSQAYTQGGTEYLECLLTSDYVSVSAKGVPRDKATIVSGAQKNAQQNKGKNDAKSKTLPDLPEPKIQLYGNTAVVQSSLAADPNGKYPAMYSSDVFAFQDGAWHAIYSQHTPVESK